MQHSWGFQFTLPCGERLLHPEDSARVPSFQFTLPCGERRLSCHRAGSLFTSFNSRSRAGSDVVPFLCIVDHVKVSIHAPVRGATIFETSISQVLFVSIHAPGRGATSTAAHKEEMDGMFQFTLPCGERLSSHFFRRFVIHVSIHAPVRGATAIRLINGAFFILFRKNFQY